MPLWGTEGFWPARRVALGCEKLNGWGLVHFFFLLSLLWGTFTQNNEKMMHSIKKQTSEALIVDFWTIFQQCCGLTNRGLSSHFFNMLSEVGWGWKVFASTGSLLSPFSLTVLAAFCVEVEGSWFSPPRLEPCWAVLTLEPFTLPVALHCSLCGFRILWRERKQSGYVE